MRPEARKHVHDALAAALLIVQSTSGNGFEDYEDDALLRSGVGQFTIIGEALLAP
jgi:hypothetical protein